MRPQSSMTSAQWRTPELRAPAGAHLAGLPLSPPPGTRVVVLAPAGPRTSHGWNTPTTTSTTTSTKITTPATVSARMQSLRTSRSLSPLRCVLLPLLPPRSSWQRSSCVTAQPRTTRTTGRGGCSTSSASRRPLAPRQHPHARWPTTTPPGQELPPMEHHRLHLHLRLRLRKVPRQRGPRGHLPMRPLHATA